MHVDYNEINPSTGHEYYALAKVVPQPVGNPLSRSHVCRSRQDPSPLSGGRHNAVKSRLGLGPPEKVMCVVVVAKVVHKVAAESLVGQLAAACASLVLR